MEELLDDQRRDAMAPQAIELVLRICDDSTKDRLLEQQGTVALTCAVRRGAIHVAPWGEAGLAARYPGINLANCLVLTTGNLEPTEAHARSAMWHGIMAVTAGACLLVARQVLSVREVAVRDITA